VIDDHHVTDELLTKILHLLEPPLPDGMVLRLMYDPHTSRLYPEHHPDGATFPPGRHLCDLYGPRPGERLMGMERLREQLVANLPYYNTIIAPPAPQPQQEMDVWDAIAEAATVGSNVSPRRGAVIQQGGNILATGWDMYTTGGPLCAELVAMLTGPTHLMPDATLISSDGAPCPRCRAAAQLLHLTIKDTT
jgi:hypothetical protein